MKIKYFFILLLLTACDRQETPKNTPKGIVVPKPLVDVTLTKNVANSLELLPLPINSPQALEHFNDIITHPWVKRQTGVKIIHREMVEDIEKYKLAYKLAKDNAVQAGQLFPSYDELNVILVREYEKLEKEIKKLNLKLPYDKYQVVMLPEDTYKRFYLDDTSLGIPYYIDVKMHSLSGKNVNEIKEWYWKLLKGGRGAFEEVNNGFIGRGDRDTEHYDPSHGFGIKDRGIYVSFHESADKLIVVYVDAPWNDFEKQKHLFE